SPTASRLLRPSPSGRLRLGARWTPRTPPPATATTRLRPRGYGHHHGLLPVRHLLGNGLRRTTGTTRAPLPARLATTTATVHRALSGRDASEQGLDRGANFLLHQPPNDRQQATVSRHRPPPLRSNTHHSASSSRSRRSILRWSFKKARVSAKCSVSVYSTRSILSSRRRYIQAFG